MLRTRDLTPDVYNRYSRDFQIIGRTFDAVINNVKMNVDLMADNPLSRNSDNRLLDLVTATIGFTSIHQYTDNDLRYLCYSFRQLVREKGTRKAIEEAIAVLLRAQGISDLPDIDIDAKQALITIRIPSKLNDVILFEDLLDYILPAGFNYEIIISTVLADNPESEVQVEESVTGQLAVKKSNEIGVVVKGFVESEPVSTQPDALGQTYQEVIVPDDDYMNN